MAKGRPSKWVTAEIAELVRLGTTGVKVTIWDTLEERIADNVEKLLET